MCTLVAPAGRGRSPRIFIPFIPCGTRAGVLPIDSCSRETVP